MAALARALAILVLSGVLLLTAPTAIAQAPGPLDLGTPDDEGLFASDVRVPYSDPSPDWHFIRVHRREKPAPTSQNPDPTWGAWADLGIHAKQTAPSTAFIDANVPSLTSEYQYRMQNCILAIGNSYYCDPTWSDESDVFAGRPECEGQEDYPPLWIINALCTYTGSSACTGSDIAFALQLCANLSSHSCILRLQPTTYTDVNLLIDDRPRAYGGEVCSRFGDHTKCLGSGLNLTKLIIQGQAGASVLKGKEYQQPYLPAPVLMVANRPGLRVRVRNVTLDGSKDVLPRPKYAQLTDPGTGEACAPEGPECTWWPPRSAWRGDGVVVWNARNGPPQPGAVSNKNTCLTNLEIRNVLARGAFLEDASNAIVEHSRVEDVGCYGLASDPNALAPCQDLKIDGQPDPDLANYPGVQMEGTGLAFGGNLLPDPTLDPTWGLKLRRNDVSRASSVGISITAGSNGYQEISEEVSVASNRVHDSGPVLLSVAGLRGSSIEDNVLENNHASETGGAIPATADPAVEFRGHISGLGFRTNTIRNTHAMALLVEATDREYDDPYGNGGVGSCIPDGGSPPSYACDDDPDTDVPNTIVGNTIAGTCVGKAHAEGYDQPAIRFLRASGVYDFSHDYTDGSNELTASECEGLLEFSRSGGDPDPLHDAPSLGLAFDSGMSGTSSVPYATGKPLASFTGINRPFDGPGGLWPGRALKIHNHLGLSGAPGNAGRCISFDPDGDVHSFGLISIGIGLGTHFFECTDSPPESERGADWMQPGGVCPSGPWYPPAACEL